MKAKGGESVMVINKESEFCGLVGELVVARRKDLTRIEGGYYVKFCEKELARASQPDKTEGHTKVWFLYHELKKFN